MRRIASCRPVIPLSVRVGILAFVLSGVSAYAQGVGAGYWHTSGNQLLDASGTPVRITGVNWFGMETSTFAPHGLWTRNYKEMLEQIKSLGFNTVRLPFSNQLFDPDSKPNGIDFHLNPDLRDLTGVELMDRIVSHAGKIGLKIMLDRHRPDANVQSQLWYTSVYPETRWIADWKMLAARYKGDPTVIAMDLLNEPHNPACWGCGELSVDWRLAAQRGGNAILSINPDLLIVVEGIESYANTSYWWGGNLKGVMDAPILLDVANRIVYSAHDYPASISPQPWFTAADYPANLPATWDSYWGYISRKGLAPVVMGEFGSRLDSASDKAWFDGIVGYLGTNGINWIFWSWNPNSDDTKGLLLDDWLTVDDRKLSKLKPIQSTVFMGNDGSPAQDPPAPTSPQVPPSSASADFCTAQYRLFSDWGSGISADLTIGNIGEGPIDGWTVSWRFSGNQTIRDLWNGRFTQVDQTISVQDEDWNAKIPVKSNVELGFVADYTSVSSVPIDITLNGFPCASQAQNTQQQLSWPTTPKQH